MNPDEKRDSKWAARRAKVLELIRRAFKRHENADDKTSEEPAVGEVAETIAELDLKIDENAEFWGTISIFGKFKTTEVSQCWTDITWLSCTVELWTVRGMLVGRMSKLSRAGENAALHHDTGPRCSGSDQGPVITQRDSIEILGLGYFDPEADGYYLMLEPNDHSRWTLKSGGDVGQASWMRFYLPHMYAEGTSTGGFAGMFISTDQLSKGEVLHFNGEVAGTGARTNGAVALYFQRGVKPDSALGIVPEEDFYKTAESVE